MCVLTPDTVSGQSVQRSTCSYKKTVSIILFSIEKEPFKNIMTWTYLISPYLYGLPKTTSRDFSQDELKNTFILFERPAPQAALSTKSLKVSSPSVGAPSAASSSGITVESISTDPINSKVSVTFSYSRDIKQS